MLRLLLSIPRWAYMIVKGIYSYDKNFSDDQNVFLWCFQVIMTLIVLMAMFA